MLTKIAPLTGADEFFNHQIVNTHAAVGTADLSWTEKVWFTLVSKDGSLQADFGLGKYANRNIMDGFAGVQHGTTQRTVRASRVLRPALEQMAVGPLSFEVIEPYRQLRIAVAANAAQPFSYDLTFTDRLPAFFEGPDMVIASGRLVSDVLRYHQAGTVSGWIEIEGQRYDVNPEEWFGFRDHSWGVRRSRCWSRSAKPAAPSPSEGVGAAKGIPRESRTRRGYGDGWGMSRHRCGRWPAKSDARSTPEGVGAPKGICRKRCTRRGCRNGCNWSMGHRQLWRRSAKASTSSEGARAAKGVGATKPTFAPKSIQVAKSVRAKA